MTYVVADDIIVPELLPPSEDGVFRTLMTHPDAKPILRDVVESYLRFPVLTVEVRNVELPISDISEKRERFDVCCTIDDGSQLDVEMQSEAMSGDSLKTNHMIVKSRAIYHLCDLHSGQGRGVRYDKLLRSFQITLCGYTVFHEREGFVSRFSFRDEDGVELSDAVGIVFVELLKLGNVISKPVETMTGEEIWSIFFAYASDPNYKGLITKLMAAKEEITMAAELLQTISTNEDERARFRMRRKFQMDMEHNLIAARDEGETSKALAVAKSALGMGMSIETIITLTGLKREEIEGLKKESD